MPAVFREESPGSARNGTSKWPPVGSLSAELEQNKRVREHMREKGHFTRWMSVQATGIPSVKNMSLNAQVLEVLASWLATRPTRATFRSTCAAERLVLYVLLKVSIVSVEHFFIPSMQVGHLRKEMGPQPDWSSMLVLFGFQNKFVLKDSWPTFYNIM